jgi:hypothetical protein
MSRRGYGATIVQSSLLDLVDLPVEPAELRADARLVVVGQVLAVRAELLHLLILDAAKLLHQVAGVVGQDGVVAQAVAYLGYELRSA